MPVQWERWPEFHRPIVQQLGHVGNIMQLNRMGPSSMVLLYSMIKHISAQLLWQCKMWCVVTLFSASAYLRNDDAVLVMATALSVYWQWWHTGIWRRPLSNSVPTGSVDCTTLRTKFFKPNRLIGLYINYGLACRTLVSPYNALAYQHIRLLYQPIFCFKLTTCHCCQYSEWQQSNIA